MKRFFLKLFGGPNLAFPRRLHWVGRGSDAIRRAPLRVAGDMTFLHCGISSMRDQDPASPVLAWGKPARKYALAKRRAMTEVPPQILVEAQTRGPIASPRGRGLGARIRTWFLTGVIVAGPLAITAYIVGWFVNTVDNWIKPLIPLKFRPETYLPFELPGFGVILAFVGLTLLGFFTANLAGRSLIRLGEAILARMPVVRSIYKSVKQIFETVFSPSETSFRRVGIIEFPSKGNWTLVFITAPPGPAIGEHLPGGEDHISVFLPCTPNPTTGFYFFLPVRDVIEVPLSPDAAAKLIMSCGVIQPDVKAIVAEIGKKREHEAA
jgi:uncharacterized membrane protein